MPGLRFVGTDLQAKDEGVVVNQQVQAFNFTGAGVVATQSATDPNQVDVTIAGAAAVTLQNAYDGGEIITITAADGPVEIITPGGAPGDVPLVLSSTSLGVTGPVFEMFHDSGSPAASDVLANWRATGRNSGAGKVTYSEIRSIISNPTAGGEDGIFTYHLLRNGTLTRLFQMFATHAAADAGVIFINDSSPSAANPAFTFRAGTDWGSVQFVLRVQDNNGAFNLMTLDGDGTLVVGSPLGANLGARLELFQSSASPAANDVVGRINFRGLDTGLNPQDYVFIDGMISDPASLASDGKLEFSIMNNETMALVLRMLADDGSAASARGVVFQSVLAAGASNIQFEFLLEENSATIGPVVSLFRRRTTDAVDGDSIGSVQFFGMDDGTPTKTKYASIDCVIVDSGDTSEDGRLDFRTVQAGTITTQMQIHNDGDVGVTRDIEAVGGYKFEIGTWVRTDVTIPVTDEVMSLYVSGAIYNNKLCTYTGSIIGLSILISTPVDVGDTLTVDVTVSGVKVFSTTMVNADGTEKTVTQAKDVDTFAVNDNIGVLYSTNVGFGPAGLDLQVQVIVEM